MMAETFLPTTRRGILVTQHAHNNGLQRKMTIYSQQYTRSFTRHSFNPLKLILILSVILYITGSVARGAETSRDGSASTTPKAAVTQTVTSSETTSTSDDNNEIDEEGIPVQGTDNLPRPFDTSIGNTFVSTTCPAFFNLFLNDPDFIGCLPLSAMLQNSKSFFEITKKSGFATTRVLDVACSVDYESCAAKMEYYGREIKTPERCGTEFGRKDQLVIQAYAAFIAYPSLFKAGCLKSDSGSYC